jgi:hypothetical protein
MSLLPGVAYTVDPVHAREVREYLGKSQPIAGTLLELDHPHVYLDYREKVKGFR